ncbi:MAG: hypothetical protein ETSY2_07580 [Candidatus Entotheonella gemina]|uniref:Sortilin N-terminal domain-containing protein n=1 Tax=Candidatus Entotheonella gemina TaxID=1429439 RepID=W4MCZ4_9BACT|nr:MAG: hypothetical protein ETSY2_07580 [Candidatus Entotheonella gemina]
MWNETQVFALTPHPHDAKVIFAGAHDGIYRSGDGGVTFDAIDSPLSGKAIWSVAVDPVHPDTIFAGTRPGAIFRSRDGGQQWEPLNAHFADACPNVRFPRVLSLVVDPSDPQKVWAGAEVDGVRRSLDGGETWETTGSAMTPGTIGQQLNNPDIHGIVVSSASPTTVLVSTPREIFASTDTGENWQPLGVQNHFPMPYCRSLALKTDDPNVLFVANGDGAAGETGTVQRSKDRGQTWETLPLPVVPNTPIWTFATHAADPDLMVTCSHYGQVLISEDAGDSWRKVKREFSEIRALAWVPL